VLRHIDDTSRLVVIAPPTGVTLLRSSLSLLSFSSFSFIYLRCKELGRRLGRHHQTLAFPSSPVARLRSTPTGTGSTPPRACGNRAAMDTWLPHCPAGSRGVLPHLFHNPGAGPPLDPWRAASPTLAPVSLLLCCTRSIRNTRRSTMLAYISHRRIETEKNCAFYFVSCRADGRRL
jgi:hypothetical protein